jgi:hypothetical protein
VSPSREDVREAFRSPTDVVTYEHVRVNDFDVFHCSGEVVDDVVLGFI